MSDETIPLISTPDPSASVAGNVVEQIYGQIQPSLSGRGNPKVAEAGFLNRSIKYLAGKLGRPDLVMRYRTDYRKFNPVPADQTILGNLPLGRERVEKMSEMFKEKYGKPFVLRYLADDASVITDASSDGGASINLSDTSDSLLRLVQNPSQLQQIPQLSRIGNVQNRIIEADDGIDLMELGGVAGERLVAEPIRPQQDPFVRYGRNLLIGAGITGLSALGTYGVLKLREKLGYGGQFPPIFGDPFNIDKRPKNDSKKKSNVPTHMPTERGKTARPTVMPTVEPTLNPTTNPTKRPTKRPTTMPSVAGETARPTRNPTVAPTTPAQRKKVVNVRPKYKPLDMPTSTTGGFFPLNRRIGSSYSKLNCLLNDDCENLI